MLYLYLFFFSFVHSEIAENFLNRYVDALRSQNVVELENLLSDNFTITQCNKNKISKFELLARISKINGEIKIRNYTISDVESVGGGILFKVKVSDFSENFFYVSNGVIFFEKHSGCENVEIFTSSIVDDKSIALNVAQDVMQRYRLALFSTKFFSEVVLDTFTLLDCHGNTLKAKHLLEILKSLDKVHLNEVEIAYLDASFITDGLLSFEINIGNLTENQYSARWDEDGRKYMLIHEYHTRCLAKPQPNTTALIYDDMIAWDMAKKTVNNFLEAVEKLNREMFGELSDEHITYIDCQNVSHKSSIDEFWKISINKFYNRSISYTQVMDVTQNFGGKKQGFSFRAYFETVNTFFDVRMVNGKYRINSMTSFTCQNYPGFFEKLESHWREAAMKKAEVLLMKYVKSIREKNLNEFHEVTQQPFTIIWKGLDKRDNVEKISDGLKVFDAYPLEMPQLKFTSLRLMNDGTWLFSAEGGGFHNDYKTKVVNKTHFILYEKRNNEEKFLFRKSENS